MSKYENAWRGYQLNYPDGWRVLYPPLDGVAFDAPDSTVFLEFSQTRVANAVQAAEQRLRKFPPHEARMGECSAQEAVVSFRQQQCFGQIRTRWQNGEALVMMVQARHGTQVDVNALLSDALASLKPLKTVERQPWREPNEGSFELQLPTGWHIEYTIRPDSAGFRSPLCRVWQNPEVVVAFEPEFHTFVQGPPQAFGDVSLPMRGLYPVLEGGFLPRWQGAKVLEFEDFGNVTKADARLRMPNGMIRVLKMDAATMAGSPRWVGGVAAFYEAPADQMARIEPVLRGLLSSYKISPQWQQQQRSLQNAQFQQSFQQSQQQSQQWMNLQQNLHNQRMHDIQAQGQHNTAMHQHRMDTADLQMNGFQQRMDSMDQMHHDNINLIRERTDYQDTKTGQVYNVPTGHEKVWSDGQNLFAGNWNVQPPADWNELKPFGPGEWHPR